jgi:hypothetical protein
MRIKPAHHERALGLLNQRGERRYALRSNDSSSLYLAGPHQGSSQRPCSGVDLTFKGEETEPSRRGLLRPHEVRELTRTD